MKTIHVVREPFLHEPTPEALDKEYPPRRDGKPVRRWGLSAFVMGWKAGYERKLLYLDNPYKDRMGAGGNVTFSRGYRNAWERGYRAYVTARVNWWKANAQIGEQVVITSADGPEFAMLDGFPVDNDNAGKVFVYPYPDWPYPCGTWWFLFVELARFLPEKEGD